MRYFCCFRAVSSCSPNKLFSKPNSAPPADQLVSGSVPPPVGGNQCLEMPPALAVPVTTRSLRPPCVLSPGLWGRSSRGAPPPGTAGAVWTRCARCRPGYFTFHLSGCGEGSAAPGPGRVRPFLAPRALPRGRRPLPVCQICLGRPCVCSRVRGAGPTACQHTGQGPPVGDGHDGLKRQPPARRLGTRLSSMRRRLGHRFEPCHWRLASVFDKAR